MSISKEKAELIAATYIKTGGNKTATAEIVKPYLKGKKKYASVAGHRMIENDRVKEILREKIKEIGNNNLVDILKRNLKQSKNYSASNEAIKITLEAIGMKEDGVKPNVNININDVESLREYIKAVNAELEKRTYEIQSQS